MRNRWMVLQRVHAAAMLLVGGVCLVNHNSRLAVKWLLAVSILYGAVLLESRAFVIGAGFSAGRKNRG